MDGRRCYTSPCIVAEVGCTPTPIMAEVGQESDTKRSWSNEKVVAYLGYVLVLYNGTATSVPIPIYQFHNWVQQGRRSDGY
jgi:hypothetical protein